MAAHSSILAWRIPWTEEPGGLNGIAESDMTERLSTQVQSIQHHQMTLQTCQLSSSFNTVGPHPLGQQTISTAASKPHFLNVHHEGGLPLDGEPQPSTVSCGLGFRTRKQPQITFRKSNWPKHHGLRQPSHSTASPAGPRKSLQCSGRDENQPVAWTGNEAAEGLPRWLDLCASTARGCRFHPWSGN